VIVAEPELFDEMGMTTGAAAEGTVGSQTQITIVDGAHPLAAGFSGDVDVTTEPATLSWGAPAAGAVVVARAAGSTTRGTLFAYERGARMVGLNAPARRVGFFLHEQTASLLTPDGQALLDAALRWATGQ
jgi:hypothetical protein